MKRRADRVAEAIRRIASELLQRELRDPRIKGFITVTKVKLTDDLRSARIFYSTMGDEKEKKRVSEGLKSAAPFIRKHIAEHLKLRYAPAVMFRIDKEVEYAKKIENILDEIHKEAKE